MGDLAAGHLALPTPPAGIGGNIGLPGSRHQTESADDVMKLCVFEGDQCIACGAVKWNSHQACGVFANGLGDRVAVVLLSIGVTKNFAQAVAEYVGLGDCGCADRQKWLNQFGYSLGIGAPHDILHRPR